ncbi:MAG: metallopeptidase TldD-related protein [Clostridia bacterium]|nr:metallopeptidase TldD-related protein [Clostridia bacterium]
MERNEFRNLLFEEALKQGCEAAETYYASGEAFSCDILEGEVNRYVSSKEGGLNLRVKFEGRDGYAYTESMEDAAGLVQRAIDNARSVESEDAHPMQGRQSYVEIAKRENPLLKMDNAEKIALTKRMETSAKENSPLVQRVSGCMVQTESGIVELHNTLGLEAVRTYSDSACFVGPVVKKGERVKDAYAFRLGADALGVESCAKEAVEKAVLALDAEPCATGVYDIILENIACADLLAAFSSMFSAEEAQKGKSLLAGKEGERIAADCITIMDDPFHPLAPRAFDGEGTPVKCKKVVENGKLNTLLHNCKTALKAGVETTGNASRGSAAGSIGVGPTVFYIQKGEKSFEQLVKELNNGLLITEISGLHAGLNPVSGDFSLMASGRLVENGELSKAVDQITVAGNFLTFMKSVKTVGSDLKATLGMAVLCPSILVGGISVAGKN